MAWTAPKTARKVVRPEHDVQNGIMPGWRGWSQITQDLSGHRKNLFYPKTNGMPLENFRKDNYITCLIF